MNPDPRLNASSASRFHLLALKHQLANHTADPLRPLAPPLCKPKLWLGGWVSRGGRRRSKSGSYITWRALAVASPSGLEVLFHVILLTCHDEQKGDYNLKEKVM